MDERADAPRLPAESLALHGECERRLSAGLRPLPDKPEETVAATLAALWHAATGMALSAQRAAATPLRDLPPEAHARLRELVGRRLAGEPLAHLTGRQEFMGVEFLAGAGALVPRKETELLGNAALLRLRESVGQRGEGIVLDACTGSDNLALALAWHEPRARVWGADLSPHAVALATRNAEHVGLGARARFLAGDLLRPFEAAGLRGRAALVVCNPPYISTLKVDTMPAEIIGHEPRLAFDGGPLGIRILQRLVNDAPAFLRPGGCLAFEVGLGQGRGLRQRLEKHGGYEDVREGVDAEGHVRALSARIATRND